MNVEDKARYGRALFLVLNTCPVALRRHIEHYFATHGFSGFDTFLDQQYNKHLLFHLRFQKCCLVHCTSRSTPTTLRAQQWDLLYRETSHRNPHGDRGKCPCMYTAIPGVTTDVMDVTLCCLLLRNICHAGVNISYIEDICTVRNQLLHASSATLDEQSFKYVWKKVETAILSLANIISVSFHKEMMLSVQETRSGFCDLSSLDSLLAIERRLDSLEETQKKETQTKEELEKNTRALKEENIRAKSRMEEIESENTNTSTRIEKIEVDNISTSERMSKLEADHVSVDKRVIFLELNNSCTNQKVSELESEKSNMCQRIITMATENSNTKQRVTTLEMKETDTKQRITTLEINKTETKQRVTTLEKNEADTKQRVVTLGMNEADTKQRLTTLEMNEADTKQRVTTLEMNEIDTKQRVDNIERVIADKQYGQSLSKTESDQISIEVIDTRKEKVLDALIKINKRSTENIQISPLQKTYKALDIDKIYTPPVIWENLENNMNEISRDKITESNSNSYLKRKKIKSPNDLFLKNGEYVRYIFLQGEAGHGKTVFCQHLLRHWCRAKEALADREELSEWEKGLGEFDFVFMIMLRYVQKSRTSLLDMICFDLFKHFSSCHEDIRQVIASDSYRCLIIVDGLDEWKISPELRENLLNEAIPDIDCTSSCTFLFTYRPWKHAEIALEVKSCDRVIQIYGLDEEGIQILIETILETLYRNDSSRKAIEDEREEILKTSKRSELGSILQIPLLLTAFVILYHNDKFDENSMTGFYVALIQLLLKWAIDKKALDQNIKQKLSKPNVENVYVPDILTSSRNKTFLEFLSVLTKLGKIAYTDLISSETFLVFSKEEIQEMLGKSELEFALKVGLLSQCEAPGCFDEENVSLNFFHKTIQEFLAGAHIVCSGKVGVQTFCDQLSSVKAILDYSNVVSFVSGLSPPFGRSISRHVVQVANRNENIMKWRETFRYRDNVGDLMNLQTKCYMEQNKNYATRRTPLKSVSEQKATEQKSDFQKLSFHVANLVLTYYDPQPENVKMLKDPHLDIVALSADVYDICLIQYGIDDYISDEVLTQFLLRSKSLQYLHVGCSHLDYIRLESIGEGLDLRVLDFRNITLKRNFMYGLVMSVKSSRKLQILKLLEIEFDKLLEILFETLKKEKSRAEEKRLLPESKSEKPVEQLRMISDHRYSQDAEFRSLAELLWTLPDCPHLSTLHIDYKSLKGTPGREVFLEVLPYLKDLVDLKIEGSSYHDNDHDESFNIVALKGISKLTHLGKIHLKNTNLNEEFTDVLSKRSNLQRLVLVDLQVEDRCMYHISQMSQIQYLRLSYVTISAAERDMNAIVPNFRELYLRELPFDDESVELMSEHKQIQMVRISYATLSLDCWRMLVTSLLKNNHRFEVYLELVNIDDETLRMIIECPHIRLIQNKRFYKYDIPQYGLLQFHMNVEDANVTNE